MVPDGVSDSVLRFAQHCQVAVCICGEEDYVAQVVAIWNCLTEFPKGVSEDDLLAAVTAICLVANGFFAFAEKCVSPDYTRGASRRANVNAILRLAQQRYADPDLTLGQLARDLQVAQEHLSRALASETRRSFRTAFRTHLNGIRLLAAIVKLQAGRTPPIRRIAADVGYPNSKELDRQFHRWFRISPRRFRGLITKIPRHCLQVRPC